MSEKQFYLLQVNDALFPIGGYSHSQGLETYIQRGIVHDADTARDTIYNQGLNVYTTIRSRDQRIASHAVRQNAVAYDRRYGYRGVEGFVDIS